MFGTMQEQDIKFFLYGVEAWQAMFSACEKARKTIDLEQYIFCDDKIGWQLAELLMKKAKEGVKIRILCDAVGSWSLYTSRLPWLMKKLDIEVRFVNVVSPWRINNFSTWFFRDHRKILVIDGEIGFTGGIGFRDDMYDWRDTNVEVKGSVIKEMLSTFEEMWAHAKDSDIISRIKKASKTVRGFHFITNSPHLGKHFLYKSVIDSLRSSKKYAYLTTPYFVPDPRLIRTLRAAVRRGVDVRIILPDRAVEPFVHRAARAHFETLLRAGVKIFEYNKSFMHAKTIVVDDEWATVGSFNLDSLSFFYNYEANIMSDQPFFVGELRRNFTEDLKNSTEVLLENWLKRPVNQKIREFLVKPISRFL